MITIDGELIAPTINIYENGAASIVNLNNPSGINNAAGGYPGQPAGVLTVIGGPGNNQLNLNDSADTTPQTGTLTSTTITGLGIGGQGIVYTNIVNNKPGEVPFTYNLVILLGTGDDVFSIESTFAATSTEVVNTGAAEDQFEIGTATSQEGALVGGSVVDLIQGPLTIAGFGNDSMDVNDRGSTIPKTGTLTAHNSDRPEHGQRRHRLCRHIEPEHRAGHGRQHVQYQRACRREPAGHHDRSARHRTTTVSTPSGAETSIRS